MQTVYVRQTSELQPCFEDPEGEELDLSATSSHPEVVAVLVLGSSITIRAVSVGGATITVTAHDPDGLTASTEIEVVVPNRAPVAAEALAPVRMRVGGARAFWVDEAFADPDGHPLTFSASSADPAVATAEIVDSARLLLYGASAGVTTVTVTATDPGDLTGTQDVEVDVREPVLLFRDDFNTSASLDDWSGLRSPDSAYVDGGKLWLDGSVSRSVETVEWVFKGAMGSSGENVITGLSSVNRGGSGVYWFSIGFGKSLPDSTDNNYRLLKCCGWTSEPAWGGNSDAIADVGELTEVTLAAFGGTLTAMAGSTLLVTVDMFAREWSGEMDSARLTAWPWNAKGAFGFYDWVELGTLDPDADAGPAPHAGPSDPGIPGLSRPWPGLEIPSVEIRKR